MSQQWRLSKPHPNPTIRIISLGAGVFKSTVMALMAAKGTQITPMPDCAIFADTGYEPEGVYEHLDWLEKQLPFPTYRVNNGNIKTDILEAKETTRFTAMPSLHKRRWNDTQTMYG